jgi:hypothetical protein
VSGRRQILLVAQLVALVLALLVWDGRAMAIERTLAGSVQLDYHLVPSQRDAEGRAITFDGFTKEAALKLAVDLGEHVSANVKICVGCHGFETDMAYFDLRATDELNVRVGRFSPSFGSFNLRHDPGNHKLSDKPLPYDMGRMLRMRDWNMGVLPSPFPDDGVEVNGTHWHEEVVQLDYAAYAVSGFKADQTATDLDFVQSRSGSAYYVDNNTRPVVGGRLALTTRFAVSHDMTLGASGMYGTFDPKNDLTYTILGGDLSFRLEHTTLRFEYLVRREQFDTSDPTRFRFVVPSKNGDFFAKHGAYAEIEQPLTSALDLILRADGMYRVGNVLLGSTLDARSSVGRLTLGTSFAIDDNVRIKASTELWGFSDRDDRGHTREMSFHLGAVATF